MHLYKVVPPPLLPFVRFVYRKIRSILKSVSYSKMYKERKGSPGVYLIVTSSHGNMGDQAITISELEFLRTRVGNREIYELPGHSYLEHESMLIKYSNIEDILLIHGGGSMGIEYFDIEQLFRRIIKAFPKNRVIILPQTLFYEESQKGQRERSRATEIYSTHKDLHIFAREQESYQQMRKTFPQNNVYLVPDFVLTLNRSSAGFQREGILLCFRSDEEKNLTSLDEEQIFSAANLIGGKITISDTVYMDAHILPSDRVFYLDKKIKEFQKASLVITDRLHGMVFSAITGTPCIAFGNYNHKVYGVYEWIRDLDYIKYLDSPSDIGDAIRELLKLGSQEYDASRMLIHFNDLEKLLMY